MLPALEFLSMEFILQDVPITILCAVMFQQALLPQELQELRAPEALREGTEIPVIPELQNPVLFRVEQVEQVQTTEAAEQMLPDTIHKIRALQVPLLAALPVAQEDGDLRAAQDVSSALPAAAELRQVSPGKTEVWELRERLELLEMQEVFLLAILCPVDQAETEETELTDAVVAEEEWAEASRKTAPMTGAVQAVAVAVAAMAEQAAPEEQEAVQRSQFFFATMERAEILQIVF
jgi:hypothetical protein